MLTFLIDGFNLLHRIPGLVNSPSPHHELIQYIRKNKLTGSSKNKVVIVFDGFDNMRTPVDREYQIRFADERTADDVIKDIIRKSRNRSQIIVVSDDREIRDCARGEGAVSYRTNEFLRKGSSKKGFGDDRPVNCSSMIEITEELEKIWIKKE